MELYQVEQTKLLANALDRISTACVITGIVTPIAALNGVNILPPPPMAPNSAWGIWFFAAMALHFISHSVLERLNT